MLPTRDAPRRGVPIHDRILSPVPAPDTIPDVEIELLHPRTLHLKFRAPGASRWGKDPHAKWLECRWVIADAPPSNIEALINTEFDTSSPLELTFKEDQWRKRVYFAVRWEGTSAEKKGPWSDIFSAVIP